MDETTKADPNLPIEVAGDTLHVRRVFGEAYREGDTTIIPVAKIFGGGGNGYGEGSMHGRDDAGSGSGSAAPGSDGSGGGGGFGVRAKPVGVYTVRDGKVRWEPALDLNRLVLGAQVVAAVAVIVIARAVRKKRR